MANFANLVLAIIVLAIFANLADLANLFLAIFANLANLANSVLAILANFTNLANLVLIIFVNFTNMADFANLVLAIFVNLADLANPLLSDRYPYYLRYPTAIRLLSIVLKISHCYPIAIQRQENISQKLKVSSKFQSVSKIYLKVSEKKPKLKSFCMKNLN